MKDKIEVYGVYVGGDNQPYDPPVKFTFDYIKNGAYYINGEVKYSVNGGNYVFFETIEDANEYYKLLIVKKIGKLEKEMGTIIAEKESIEKYLQTFTNMTKKINISLTKESRTKFGIKQKIRIFV